jgi:hypothetical protein
MQKYSHLDGRLFTLVGDSPEIRKAVFEALVDRGVPIDADSRNAATIDPNYRYLFWQDNSITEIPNPEGEQYEPNEFLAQFFGEGVFGGGFIKKLPFMMS